MLRGNHEDAVMNQLYGFNEECRSRIDDGRGNSIFRTINGVFDWLPLGALVNKKILCVHGGIGNLKSLDDIRQISRPLRVDLKMVRTYAHIHTDCFAMYTVHAYRTSLYIHIYVYVCFCVCR
jgi:diadenosine tetraphosphatase ApaH/serine/threonine PP2A family protein phosphatase